MQLWRVLVLTQVASIRSATTSTRPKKTKANRKNDMSIKLWSDNIERAEEIFADYKEDVENLY